MYPLSDSVLILVMCKFTSVCKNTQNENRNKVVDATYIDLQLYLSEHSFSISTLNILYTTVRL